MGVRLRRARGLMGRDEGKIATGAQISFARDVQMLIETCRSFFKGNGTFLVFFLLNILCDVCLFIINNKKS